MQSTNVKNMLSPRTGKPVANQFIITTKDGLYFQSYDAVIAFEPYSKGEHSDNPNFEAYLDNGSSGYGWDYSNTTRKYLYMFLGIRHVGKKAILDGLKNGKYQLANLNQ